MNMGSLKEIKQTIKGKLLTYNSKGVKELLKRKKFKVEESLTEALLKSLATKVFYTLAHYKFFDRFGGTIQLANGIAEITPYRSVVGDVRYVFTLRPEGHKEIVVYWDGKMSLKSKSTASGVTVDQPDLNFVQDLDFFVKFEQKVVEALHAIEDQFFEAVPVKISRESTEEAA